MDDDILYREFWVKTTRQNVRELSKWLCEEVGADNFDKLNNAEEPCKTDKKSFVSMGTWILSILDDHPELLKSTTDQNKKRMLSNMMKKLSK